MKYGTIAYLNKPVSRIVMGTMCLSEHKMEESFRLLDEVYALGINTFDTAAVYPNNGEAVLVHWMAERGLRDQAVLLTKGAHHNQWRKRVTPYDILSDVSDTLAKPGAESIDIFMLHRDDESVPVSTIMDTLNRLRDAGRIHTFGCSNWSFQRLEEANDYATQFGLMGFSSISPHYSLAEQVNDPWGEGCVTLTGDGARNARDLCRRTQMPVFCYSSLSRGFFSGRFKADEPEKAAAVLDKAAQLGYLSDANLERLGRAEKLSKELHLSVAQIALAWLFHQPMNLFALVGAESGAQMAENLTALETELTETQCRWLNLESNEA